MGPLVALLCGGVIYTDDNTINIPSADIGLLPSQEDRKDKISISNILHISCYHIFFLKTEVEIINNDECFDLHVQKNVHLHVVVNRDINILVIGLFIEETFPTPTNKKKIF